MPQSFIKGSTAIMDYSADWDDGYLTTGEKLSTSSWSFFPPSTSFSLTTQSFSTATSIATVWCSGGVHGDTFYVRNRVVTTGGRTDLRTLKIDIWGPR